MSEVAANSNIAPIASKGPEVSPQSTNLTPDAEPQLDQAGEPPPQPVATATSQASPDPTPPQREGWRDMKSLPESAVERTQLKVSIGKNESGQTNFIATQNNFAAASSEVMFSPELASRLSDAAERELRAVVTLHAEFAERMIAAVEKRRVILLSGVPQSGKGTVAKYLAAELATRHKLANETYVVGPLESRVRVLPRDLASSERFRSRVTLFEDAFDYSNKDLLTFFRSDSAAWEEFRTSLAANDAYFIFTTSQAQMEPFRDRLRLSCFEVPVSPELTATAIDRKLLWLESQADSPREKLAGLRSECERIAARMRTIPRAALLIDAYIEGDDSFDALLERHASASPSLLDDLQTDVDSWCFAVTLAIVETADEPLPWSAFDRLRRLLTSHIKTDRELFPRLKVFTDTTAEQQPSRSATAWLSDKPLLARCQAVFRKDASGLRDVVAFADPACARSIRQSLLDHHRRVLLILAPLLRGLAEDARSGIPEAMRVIAAHTLGRIGGIDPPEISLPLIESEWVSHADELLRKLVGAVVRGVLAGEDERYRTTVLQALERLADVEAESLDEQARIAMLTAISAYAQLGNHPAARPMAHFRDIASRHCVPLLMSAYEHFVEVETSNREQVAARSQAAVNEARDRGRIELLRGEQDIEQCNLIAFPLTHAIARICHQDVQALSALRDWLSTGGAGMRLLVPYLFLVNNGIANALDDLAVAVDGADGPVAINAVIFAAAASRQSQHDLAAFLCDIYDAIGRHALLPADVREYLEQRLADCMTQWVTRATAAPQFRPGMEELFGTLAAARGGVMRRWLFALVKKTAFAETDELKAFASAARRQMDL